MQRNIKINIKCAHRLVSAFYIVQVVLLVVLLNSNNLNTLVVATSLAYTVSKINLATLGALYKIGGSLKLPNA